MANHPDIKAEVLTRDQVRRVDRIAIEEFGIPGVVLMENAGRNAAAVVLEIVRDELGLESSKAQIAVICGGGNNGGDGFVIARHLHNVGIGVTIYAAKDPDSLTGDAAINHAICSKMGLPIHRVGTPCDHADKISNRFRLSAQELSEFDVLVDALLGTGFTGQIRTPISEMIEQINLAVCGGKGSRPVVLAVDVPSGLNCDTGRPSNPTVRADVTVTFVASKAGFSSSDAKAYTGRVVVADIGVPPGLVARIRRHEGPV